MFFLMKNKSKTKILIFLVLCRLAVLNASPLDSNLTSKNVSVVSKLANSNFFGKQQTFPEEDVDKELFEIHGDMIVPKVIDN